MNTKAIMARQVELTYRQFPLLATVSMVTAMLFAAVMVNGVGTEAAALWFGLATVVMALRVFFHMQFKAMSADEEQAPRWRAHLFIGAATSGLVWGAAALFYLATSSLDDRVFVIVVALTTVSTGAHWHAAFPRASAAYVVTALTPFTLAMFADAGQNHLSLGVASMLLMAVLIAIARRSGNLILDWCVQAARNHDLAHSLEAAYAHLVSEIQQRQQADEHRDEYGRKLEEAQQLAHIGHWEWDYAARQATFSREALRLFGKPEGWNPSLDEIARIILDGGGTDFLQRIRQANAERLDEICIEHRIGKGADARDVYSRLRIKYGRDGKELRLIAAMQDVTELHKYEQRLHSLAFFDTLTGLPNRALFNDRMRQGIAEAAWHKGLMGMMMLDLDRFKAINDTFGHGNGDRLLCEAARRLSNCVRSYDTVARLGGDEFAILLPEIRHGADLGNIARKIINAFAEPFHLDGKNLFVTCSIGIALYPADGLEATELLRCSDLAMYHAKGKGRNNFQFYSTELTARSTERLALDAQLRQAERNGEFELHYQPQVDLNSGRLIGVEALLRWHHPDIGLVMPDKFIGIAEDTGVIVSIGEWVLRTACLMARRWNEGRSNGIIKVAVNLSPRQFRMNDLVGTIRDLLEQTGCRPEWLECEITESLLLDDCDEVRTMLFAMNAMGITLAIDDFGTGYSSLGYLNRYPVDSIKIDRSFVRDITAAPKSAELVKAIIAMARSLRLETVAEGVETADQQEFLMTCGCHTGQGWLYGKAMPQAQFEALLRKVDRSESTPPTHWLMGDGACADGVGA
jgi:diguanylate cyclase (GGDEF)-like protein